MKLINNNFIKKIVVVLSIVIMLVFFCLTPIVDAATKTKMDEGEFYYSGTTEGAYVVTEGIFAWLLSKIGEIADFLLGIFTMGGRMVFVGWTALFEEIMTGALQATTGVPMEIDTNSTQLDGFISSSNNVTLEAIIYNRVPVLNINLFAEDKVGKCVSGTGHYWVKCSSCADSEDTEGLCRMEECACESCATALEEAGIRDINVITVIKDNVKMWYYVIRLLAMAAMLLILIFVGIKIAISTVAEDKAMYKRMLADWVVGIILVFSVQYIMIAIINLNEVLVDVAKNAQTGITEIVKKEFNIETMSNQELEISIYQAVRTRAYDAKLINGTTGMILYISLVFMAIKYLFIYIKRYFAIIVLTLMAPGVAFSYAIQKVLTGKSTAFSNWLQEYFLNVIIQTVHAIIYTAFISMTLVVSLNSISGMIVALIIMNFMADADKIFKKIFKLSGGSGSISEETSNTDVKNYVNSVKSAATFMTGNALLKNSPITKAVKAPLKAARTGLVLGATNIKAGLDKATKADDRKVMKQMEKDVSLSQIKDRLKAARSEASGTKTTKEFSNYFSTYDEAKDVIGLDGEDAMEKELVSLEKQAFEDMENGVEGAQERYEELQEIRRDFDKVTKLSTAAVFGAHISEFLNKENYYDYRITGQTKDGKNKVSRKLKNGLFGKIQFDRTKNKWVRHTMSELISDQLKSEKLLGFTEADKKLMKETTDLFKGTLIGMGSLFVGMGTVVSSPGVGFGLLANGINSQITLADKAGLTDVNRHLAPRVDEKNKRFSFRRFNKGAKQTIMRAAISQAEKEKNRAVVQNVARNHKTLHRALRIGGLGLTVAGGIAIQPLVAVAGIAGAVPLAAGATAYVVGKNIKRYSGPKSSHSLVGRISKQHFKQYKELKEAAIKDEIDILAREEKIEFKKNYEAAILAIESYVDDPQKGQREKEELGAKTDTIVETPTGKKVFIEAPVVKQEQQVIEEAVTEVILKTTTGKITRDSFVDAAEIERVIEEKLQRQGDLEEGQSARDIITELDKKMAVASISVLKAESARSDEGKKSEVGISKLEQAIVKESIREMLQSGEIGSVDELSADKIQYAVSEKKKQIAGQQSVGDVLDSLRSEKPTEISTEIPLFGTKKTAESYLSQGSKENPILEALGGKPGKKLEEYGAISSEELNYIQSTILEIKRLNTPPPPPPRTESQRKEEKKKRIQALERILEAEAKGELYTEGTEETQEMSVDAVIEELFKNTSENEAVELLRSNVRQMKRLNRRGEGMKMTSRDSNYRREKSEADIRSVKERYPDFVPDGSKQHDQTRDGSKAFDTSKDGNRDLNKMDTYGPVTNIIDLINAQKRKNDSK